MKLGEVILFLIIVLIFALVGFHILKSYKQQQARIDAVEERLSDITAEEFKENPCTLTFPLAAVVIWEMEDGRTFRFDDTGCREILNAN